MCIDDRVEQLARSAIERLDYFGIGEVEILRDKQTGEDYLIEINARPWLQYALAPASNHDFLGLVLGLPLATQQRPCASGKRGSASVRIFLSLFLDRSAWSGMDGLGFFRIFDSIARSNVFALFDWRDLRPFLLSLRHR